MIRKEEWKIYNNVFDSFTLKLLFDLSAKHFDELYGSISVGKEANVFSAAKKEKYIAIKIWRLDNVNFKKMYDYIRQDSRYEYLKSRKRDIVFAWVQREYRNLLKAREVIRVPTPIAIKNHMLLMEFIGDNNKPAPQLKQDIPENPKKFYDQILKDIKKLYKHGLVHGDLSEYNILNYKEKPVYIDFSQGTLTTSHNAQELLKRDIQVINTFFKKLIKTKDSEEIYHNIITTQ